MVLLFALGLFIVSCILSAVGSDWEAREHNANVRAEYLADTINRNVSNLGKLYEEESETRNRMFEQFLDSNNKASDPEPYRDNRGKLVRKRTVYNHHGYPIAEEIVEIGFND